MAEFSLGPKARSAGYRLAGFDEIGSTNSEALAAAAAGDPGGIWFAALKQTAGRGRRGRAWESPSGNLAAKQHVDPAILNDPGIYPDDATMKRLFTNTAYDERSQRTVTRLWTRVKTGR